MTPRLFVEFTHGFHNFHVVKFDEPQLSPVVEVHEYDQSGQRALVEGTGRCPLWFSLDRLRVMPAEIVETPVSAADAPEPPRVPADAPDAREVP